MKTIFQSMIYLFLFLSFNLNAQQDKDWNSKTYPLGEFKELYLEGGYHVFLIQGNENSLTVKASDDDVLDYLNVKNDEQALSLNIKRKGINLDRVYLYITFKQIDKINVEGGVYLKTSGYLDLQKISLQVQGAAKINLEMKASEVQLTGEGGMLVELNGVTNMLDVRISGAGHVNASELKSQNVSFKIEGVGTGTVYATESLEARIIGAGKIKYKGNPKVSRHIEGLGSISSD